MAEKTLERLLSNLRNTLSWTEVDEGTYECLWYTIEKAPDFKYNRDCVLDGGRAQYYKFFITNDGLHIKTKQISRERTEYEWRKIMRREQIPQFRINDLFERMFLYLSGNCFVSSGTLKGICLDSLEDIKQGKLWREYLNMK